MDNQEHIFTFLNTLLGVSFTLSVVFGIFLPLFFNRRRELLDETIDMIISEDWSTLKYNESNKKFSLMMSIYQSRFNNINPPHIRKIIYAIFLLSVIISIVLLILTLLELHINFILLILTSLSFIVIFSLVLLLITMYLVPDSKMSSFPKPQKLKTWNYLQNNLGIYLRTIGEKFGFIKINGIKKGNHNIYFEYQNYLIEPFMKYDLYILTKGNIKKINKKKETLEHEVWDGQEYYTNETKYQICFVIDMPEKTITPGKVKKIAIIFQEKNPFILSSEAIPVEFEQVAFEKRQNSIPKIW